MVSAQAARKRRGAWYTPPELVDLVVDWVLSDVRAAPGTIFRVLDPACGDGRFLVAIQHKLSDAGFGSDLTGCDIDAEVVHQTRANNITTIHGDALTHDWGDGLFDIVIGNPPYLSQMSSATSRGGSSSHGGGPYADAAAEFLSLSMRLARPDGGRVALVLPQSILATRDAGPVRSAIGEQCDLAWSWWAPSQQHFDASVNVCALGFRRPSSGATDQTAWNRVVTDRLGIPAIDTNDLSTNGAVGDRSHLNANFRDEYYALVPAVSDDCEGPRLVTSGLIDPGVCHWGRRQVRFAKNNFDHPRVDLSKLTGRFGAWADRKLVPKVLVANQTKIIEAVADPGGEWLPGVPVTTVTPEDPALVWPIAAILTSPVASAIAWHTAAGSGLTTRTVRVGPAVIAATPWPAGDLSQAIDALESGDIKRCGELVTTAYGLSGESTQDLIRWWSERLPA